jgi:hypothetical protein
MEKFRALSPDEQNIVRDNFHRFQNLPAEQRRSLRERWQSATPAERQKMIARVRARRVHPAPMERRKD